MQNSFDEIRDQIHEIRNWLAPFELKVDKLEERLEDNHASIEAKISALQSGLSEQSNDIAKISGLLAGLLERVAWIELALNVPHKPEKPPSPVHVDKMDPTEPGISQV